MTKTNESFELGNASEKLFFEMARRRKYAIRKSNKQQNIYDHIDVFIERNNVKKSIDIKSQKRETRHSTIQDDWHVLEFIAVTYPITNEVQLKNAFFNPLSPDFTIGSNRKGWLYGKCTHIAFELNYSFVLVKRETLLKLSSELIDFTKYVSHSKDAKYCVFSRKNRGDLISYIHKNDFFDIADEIWIKPIILT